MLGQIDFIVCWLWFYSLTEKSSRSQNPLQTTAPLSAKGDGPPSLGVSFPFTEPTLKCAGSSLQRQRNNKKQHPYVVTLYLLFLFSHSHLIPRPKFKVRKFLIPFFHLHFYSDRSVGWTKTVHHRQPGHKSLTFPISTNAVLCRYRVAKAVESRKELSPTFLIISQLLSYQPLYMG